jgi:L-rhamnose isomerase/sugar isomerase
MNSNTFQDQEGQNNSYRYGSLSHADADVRRQAIEHNIDCIGIGQKIGSKALTVWVGDGSNFAGQSNFRNSLARYIESMREIYSAVPADWKLFIEHKFYEPAFYSSVINDWGTSYICASELGEKALCLVDLGHHAPNVNIEQIVSRLIQFKKLGGFHFNDSKYGDDDLTVGSIKPYQLFLIFNELVEGMDAKGMNHATDLSWMIDASHNVKDPLEDLLQSVEAILITYAQALLVNREQLAEAQYHNDVVKAQEILQQAFRTDVRALVAEARLRNGGALNPLAVYRHERVREQLIKDRGAKTIATGL